MSHDQRSVRYPVRAMAAIALSLVWPGLALAQTVGPPPAPGAKPSATAPANNAGGEAAAARKNADLALKAYGAGTRAYESGKAAEAVEQLSTALAAGGLPSSQMAKALYYRGAAYRKQGKPAMAISDLTSALWLKGGLSDSDRALATEARQAAYREAGLGDKAPAAPSQQNQVVAQAPVAPPALPAAPTAAPGAAPAVAATAPSPAPASSGPALPWQAASGAETAPAVTLGASPDPATPPVARSKVAQAPLENSLSSAGSSYSDGAGSAAPVQALAVAPAPAVREPSVEVATAGTAVLTAVEAEGAPAAPPAGPLGGAGKAVSGFFNTMGSSIGKMFTGDSSSGADAGGQATLTASSPVATSSTGPIYPASAEAGAQPVAWGNAVVAPAKAASKQKVALAQPAPGIPAPEALPATSKAASGGIHLQVASVRSREEAERVSVRLRDTPAVQSSAKVAEIDEAVIGNMGTFYRVRLGPFANAAEPTKLCAALKPEGYDCLVVSQ